MWCKWVVAKEGRRCKDVAVHQDSAKDDHDHAAATTAAAQQQQQQQPGREGGRDGGRQASRLAGWQCCAGFFFSPFFGGRGLIL